MQLNAAGRIVASCWEDIPEHFPTVSLDGWVIMPNHVHGIVVITTSDTTSAIMPLAASTPSLGVIVGAFKSAATKRVNEWRRTPETLWQRSYYERVIRDDRSLNRVRQYIEENPVRWAYDTENLDAVPEP